VEKSVGRVKRRFATASICGGNGLLRALVVALPGGRGRWSGCARAGRRGRARACPASHRDEQRRWRLPAEALVELEGRGGLEQRISAAIVLGIGGRPQRRAAGGRDLCLLLQASNLGKSRCLVPKLERRLQSISMTGTENCGRPLWVLQQFKRFDRAAAD